MYVKVIHGSKNLNFIIARVIPTTSKNFGSEVFGSGRSDAVPMTNPPGRIRSFWKWPIRRRPNVARDQSFYFKENAHL